MRLVVPSDPVHSQRPDEHFADDAAAALDLGIPVTLLDHDAVVAGDVGRAATCFPPDDDVVYRGWMVDADRYDALDEAARRVGAHLRTSGAAYRRAHELPGWYRAVAAHTPATVWTRGTSVDDLVAAARPLSGGPAVLKDYVKSLKHDWDEAAFVPDVADEARLRAVAGRFLERRADGFTGGFALRRFEEFEGDEVRTWWIDGRCALITAHPDTPGSVDAAVPVDRFADSIVALRCRFVTADVVRRRDGVWRIVEVGDGQVSDRPVSAPAHELLQALSPRNATDV